MATSIGKKLWAIAEGYIPPTSVGEGRALESHETVCMLNAGATDAHVAVTIFFSDRELAECFRRGSGSFLPAISPSRRLKR